MNELGTFSGVAGEAMTDKQFYIVQLAADGDIEVGESATDLIVGVLLNTPAEGEAATVQFSGIAKIKCGGSVGVGALVTSDSAGKGVATTTNANFVVGRALEAGDDGDIIRVILMPHKAWFA